MQAAILAVGSELLGTDRLDTNSLLLTKILRRHGVALRRKAVVGDELEAIVEEVDRLSRSAELLLVTGGLGPTADDLTREALARLLGRPLRLDPAVLADIAEKFARFRMTMPEVNRKQAEVIEGAEVLPNRRGTAPGLRLQRDGCTLFLFPGVPNELEGLIETTLEPWLAERSGGHAVDELILKVACVPESALAEIIAPYYDEFGDAGLSILSSPGDIQLRLTAGGAPADSRRELERRAERLGELLGAGVYGRSAGETLERVVGRALLAAGRTVATAESCTAGLLAERLTRPPGSSGYFLGSVVAYADRLKSALLGVPAELVEAQGAVSEAVARAMAVGVRERLGSHYGIALTGIAGPGGGSAEKPVGTVHLALAGPGDDEMAHRRLSLPGPRQRVRLLSSQWALDLLRRRLAPPGPEGGG